MEFIILLIIFIITYIILKIIFDVNLRKLKQICIDEQLDELTAKYSDNIEICKWYLNRINNKNVKIEEDKKSNVTLYLVKGNKIFIGNLNNSYTRIQTIAHECLHSIQSKKLLWFNFIFSNIYLIYFALISVFAILKILPEKSMFLSILIIMGLIYYSVRTYLEDDAMIKARFLSEEYMKETKILQENQIQRVLNKYDKINDLGIKTTNFQLLAKTLIKDIILTFIFIII